MLSMYIKWVKLMMMKWAKLMEETAEIQTILENSGFYMIDAKIQEIANDWV